MHLTLDVRRLPQPVEILEISLHTLGRVDLSVANHPLAARLEPARFNERSDAREFPFGANPLHGGARQTCANASAHTFSRRSPIAALPRDDMHASLRGGFNGDPAKLIVAILDDPERQAFRR